MSNTGSAEKFTITAIGTCRLDAPLRLGAQESGLSWTGQRIYGYAHSISECVQQVRFLKHEYVPDPALWDIIGKKNLKRALSERHQPSDLYLLEISSRKQLYVDEHAVQINHLKSKCFPFLSDVGRKTHYWNLLRRKDFAGQRQMVDDFAAEFGLSEHVHEILIKLRLEDTTDADLIKGLGEIREFLQEPTIVTHVNALDRMGQPIPSRALCVEQVERVSKSLGLAVFNPTSLMQEFGQDNAIEDESDSLAHFTEAFSGRLFERWHEEFLMRRIDEILISTPTEPNRSKYAAHITSRAKLGKVSEGLARLRSVDASPSTSSAWRLSLEVDLLARAGQKSRAEETAVQAFELGDVSPTVLQHAMSVALGRANHQMFEAVLIAGSRDVQAASQDWFTQGLNALAQASANKAMPIYEELLQSAPDVHAMLLPRYTELVLHQPDAANDMAIQQFVSECNTQFDPRALARLVLIAKANRSEFLFTLLGQSPKRFVHALEVFGDAGHHDLAIRAVQTAGVLLDDQTTAKTEVAQHWARHLDKLDDPKRRLIVTQMVLALAPDLRLAMKHMRDLRKRYLAIARVAYENQDIASLEQLQDEAARVTPKIDDVPYFLARLHYLHNRFETATALARTAANWAPSRARNWGVVLRCAHQTDDLLTEFGAAVKVQQTAEPDDESWLSEALKRLEPLPRKALLIARETDDNLTRLKYLKIAMHSPELQEEAQERIASTKRLLVKEMLVHEKEVEPELSLEFGRRAFPYISDMRMGLISIARLLLREGYHHEALPLWEKIVLADPDNQKWQIQLGKCRQKVGNVQKQAPVVTI